MRNILIRFLTAIAAIALGIIRAIAWVISHLVGFIMVAISVFLWFYALSTREGFLETTNFFGMIAERNGWIIALALATLLYIMPTVMLAIYVFTLRAPRQEELPPQNTAETG